MESGLNGNEASIQETVWFNKYVENGWNLINRIKTGGIGGGGKYDYSMYTNEYIIEISKQYTSLTKFKNAHYILYNIAIERGLIDDMKWFRKSIKYNDDIVREIVKNCKEYKDIPSGVLQYIRRNSMDIILPPKNIQKIKSIEEVLEIAKRYDNLPQLRKEQPSIVSRLYADGYLPDKCPWLKNKYDLINERENKCLEIAKSCESMIVFKNRYPKEYQYLKSHKAIFSKMWLNGKWNV